MKINKTNTIAFTLLTLLAAPQVMAEDNWNNRFNLLLGQKHLDKDDFEDTSHGALGLSFDIQHKTWPVSIAIDLMTAGKETKIGDEKIEKVTGGLHLGVRKYWQLNENLEPYLGVGLNFSAAEHKEIVGNVTEKQDDDDVGYWVAAGVNWTFDESFNVGAQVRYSDAEVTLFDSTINTGGVYTMMTFGYNF